MKRNVQVAAFLLAFVMLGGFGARAQAPGGVSPAAWYKRTGPILFFPMLVQLLPRTTQRFTNGMMP